MTNFGGGAVATLLVAGCLAVGVSASVAQGMDGYAGEWAGDGDFRRPGAAADRRFSCRLDGTAKSDRVLSLAIRCATRQAARDFEVLLGYGASGRIVSAEVVKPHLDADESIAVRRTPEGLEFSGSTGARLSLERVGARIRLELHDRKLGSGEATLMPR